MADRYVPEQLDATSIENLAESLMRELRRISNAFEVVTISVPVLHEAPSKPREILLVGADGTDWNPGGGKGLYAYIDGIWEKLD
jgi:hypothetical protein